MTSAASPIAPAPAPERSNPRRRSRINPLRTAGPTWFVTVMGTGIVANAVTFAPVDGWAARGFAAAVWIVAAVLLVLVSAVTVVQLRRRAADDMGAPAGPGAVAFWGTMPMALTTVGTGALLDAAPLLGSTLGLAVALVLCGAGTVIGVVVAVTVPVAWARRRTWALADVAPVWILAVVPPMVSAAALGGILPRLSEGPERAALLVAGYGLFGLGLALSLTVITVVVLRIAVHGPGPTAAAPTVFIVLGPLGQSVTAACLLGAFAREVVPGPLGAGLDGFATGFGVVVIGVAMVWLPVAVAIVARAVRRGMPFALTWWSFTFPIGTCVTGTSLLAARVDVAAVEALALTLLAALVLVWVTVLVRTALGVLRSGMLPRLLRDGRSRAV
ncbi:MAG: C4-dicarboxylate ABC transporter [Patulibacter sp.]